jgi:hypothetical protein
MLNSGEEEVFLVEEDTPWVGVLTAAVKQL